MSFGVVQNAIATIKSDKVLLLSKRNRLKNTLSFGTKNRTEYNLPKATREDLLGIRRHMTKEHIKRRLKQFILLGVLALIIISVLLYFA